MPDIQLPRVTSTVDDPGLSQFSRGMSLASEGIWISREDLFRQFAPFGYTQLRFNLLLKSLGVPIWWQPDGTALINVLAFRFAIYYMSRIGSPDFVSPGGPRRHRSVTRLDLKAFKRDWKEVLSEMLLARRLRSLSTPIQMRKTLEGISESIAANIARLYSEEIQKGVEQALDEGRTITEPSEEGPLI